MSHAVTGRVIEKGSGAPVPGVAVTNGESIVETAEDGSYGLDIAPSHRFVYISVPDTHKVDGRFYIETSTPGLDLQHLGFVLVPAPGKSKSDFTFVQISDIHVIETQSFRSIDRSSLRFYSCREVLALALQQIAREVDPAFIVPTGDLTHRGSEAELRSVRDAGGTIGTPVFNLFAGHDGTTEHFKNGDGATCTRIFERLFGPPWYSFDWGGKHFVLFTDEDLVFSPADQRRKEAWLYRDLSLQPPERDIYLFVHCPPRSAFLERLSQYNVKMLLFGHYHASRLQRIGDMDVVGTPPPTFAGMDTSPRGYRTVQCHAGGHRIDYRPLSLHDTTRLSRAACPALDGPLGQWRLAWQRELPATNHRANPVLAGGALLLSLQDETLSGHDGVLGLDPASGERLFHLGTDTAVKNKVALLPDTNCAAALSTAGKLYVFDTLTGASLWERELPGHPVRWLYTAPIAADGVLYAGGKAGCGAFDVEDGTALWYTELERGVDFQPCYASPQIWEDLLIVSIQGKGMVALQRSDGALRWDEPFRVKYQSASPVVTGELLATGGNYTDLGVLRATDGAVVWQFPFEHKYVCALAADDRRMYAGTPTGELQCYELETGEHHWSFRTGDDLMDFSPYQMGIRTILAQPRLFEGHLLVAGCDGWLYVVEPESGACRDQTFFGAPITSAPCASGDRLYIATYDRKVHCLTR